MPPLRSFLIALFLAAAGLFFTRDVQARQGTPDPSPPSDKTCLECHGQPGLVTTLENGEAWNLYVSPESYQDSVHGVAGYACVQCHSTVGNYPHPPFSAQDARDASLQLYPLCQTCHMEQFQQAQDGVHARALQAGNRNAAICSDCHTAHQVRRLHAPGSKELLPEARIWIPRTCAQCHNAIYLKYRESVHGSALEGEGNPDVPTCIDCHGVHQIEDPTTAAFRLASPQLCARCHTNPAIMDKYGISTQVLDTYVADFHGTTVTLFERQSPDAPTNKPVCYDCHGVHDIQRTDDPQKGLQVKKNILARCRVCHPDASANFPSAWLSHYIPSPTRYPLVFTVNTFYKFFIPGVLGGMAVLVVLDLNWTLRQRFGRRKPATPEDQIEGAAAQASESEPTARLETTPKEETGATPVLAPDDQEEQAPNLREATPIDTDETRVEPMPPPDRNPPEQAGADPDDNTAEEPDGY